MSDWSVSGWPQSKQYHTLKALTVYLGICSWTVNASALMYESSDDLGSWSVGLGSSYHLAPLFKCHNYIAF